MFIYKITVNKEIYIGFDTKESYMQSRWKTHCREANGKCKQSVHKAMKKAGLVNVQYEIVEDEFTSYVELAKAEIQYIKKFNSFRNGLNDSIGGDGLGRHDFVNLSENEIFEIKQALSESMSEYNNNVKWANTSLNDRKILTSHLHNEEIYNKKSVSLIETYKHNPDLAKAKAEPIQKWQSENRESLCKQNKINGAKGADKVSKQIKVINPEGKEMTYKSKSAFARDHGFILKSIINKTNKGSNHNGWKGWEI